MSDEDIPIEESSDEPELVGVEVHAQFATSDSDRVSKPPDVPSERIDPRQTVFAVFGIRQNEVADLRHGVKDRVSEEIQEVMFDEKNLDRLARDTSPESIQDSEPHGQPETQLVQIGNVAITKDGETMIFDLSLDPLRQSIE